MKIYCNSNKSRYERLSDLSYNAKLIGSDLGALLTDIREVLNSLDDIDSSDIDILESAKVTLDELSMSLIDSANNI